MRALAAIALAVLAAILLLAFDISLLCERTLISILLFVAGSMAALGSRHYFKKQQQPERIERKAA